MTDICSTVLKQWPECARSRSSLIRTVVSRFALDEWKVLTGALLVRRSRRYKLLVKNICWVLKELYHLSHHYKQAVKIIHLQHMLLVVRWSVWNPKMNRNTWQLEWFVKRFFVLFESRVTRGVKSCGKVRCQLITELTQTKTPLNISSFTHRAICNMQHNMLLTEISNWNKQQTVTYTTLTAIFQVNPGQPVSYGTTAHVSYYPSTVHVKTILEPSSSGLHSESSQRRATQNQKTEANLAEKDRERSAPAQVRPGDGKGPAWDMATTHGGLFCWVPEWVSEQFLHGTSAQYRLCSAILLKLYKS